MHELHSGRTKRRMGQKQRPLPQLSSATVFEALTLYHLPAHARPDAARLDEQLAALPCKPCGPTERLSVGFVPPRQLGAQRRFGCVAVLASMCAMTLAASCCTRRHGVVCSGRWRS